MSVNNPMITSRLILYDGAEPIELLSGIHTYRINTPHRSDNGDEPTKAESAYFELWTPSAHAIKAAALQTGCDILGNHAQCEVGAFLLTQAHQLKDSDWLKIKEIPDANEPARHDHSTPDGADSGLRLEPS